MVASVLAKPNASVVHAELLRPDPLPGGILPEDRVTVGGISWDRYLDYDKSLGEDRPGPRLYYLGGELEILLSAQSRLLPALDISLIEHCVVIPSWQQARQTFRAGLARAK